MTTFCLAGNKKVDPVSFQTMWKEMDACAEFVVDTENQLHMCADVSASMGRKHLCKCAWCHATLSMIPTKPPVFGEVAEVV